MPQQCKFGALSEANHKKVKMSGMIEKIGGALTSIIVTALIAIFALVVKNHETNSQQQSDINLIKYRLDELQDDFDDMEKDSKNER